MFLCNSLKCERDHFSGKMKPDILAKVANQAATLYSEANQCVAECGQSLPKDVAQAISMRHDKFLVS